MARTDKLTIEPGNRYRAYMPYSEACMHLELAGKPVWFELIGLPYPMVQLYRRDKPGGPLVLHSFPITTGEAGIYHEGTVEDYRAGRGFYCHPTMNAPATTPAEALADDTIASRHI